MPQTTLRLLQRCNNAPFVFRSVKKRTLALVLADGSSCKALQIRYCRVSAPLRPSICLFRKDCNVAFILFLFFLKAGPALHIHFLFSQKQGTFRNAPYFAIIPNIYFFSHCLSETPLPKNARSYVSPSAGQLFSLLFQSFCSHPTSPSASSPF